MSIPKCPAGDHDEGRPPAPDAPAPRWRPAVPADAAAIGRLSRALLGPYGEADAIFAERLRLCPEGCHMLVRGDRIGGYMVSHPWRRADPPALHRPLGALPGDPDCWYVHDIAIDPGWRGGGAARSIVGHVGATAAARGLTTVALVAVAGAATYWRRLGFVEAMSGALRAKLDAYGGDAVYMERRTAG